MVRIRRAMNDALISIAALIVLLAVLASVNDRVRNEVSSRLNSTRAQTEVSEVAANVHSVADDFIDLARHQTIEHAPVVIFVIVACVLTGFMLRT